MSFLMEHYREIGSTNDRAKELAEAGVLNVCVSAEMQTGGRGRKGRSFFSPSGTGLYVSYVLPPEDLNMLTVAGAVYAAEAIEKLTEKPVGIRWVNDLLMDGRKICGILAEGTFSAEGTLRYAVIGIGINVLRTEFPPELCGIAGDLESLTGKRVDRSELLGELTAAFERKETAGLLEAYRARSVVLGREITVYRGNETFRAKALDLSEDGGLWIQKGPERILLRSGEVSVRI